MRTAAVTRISDCQWRAGRGSGSTTETIQGLQDVISRNSAVERQQQDWAQEMHGAGGLLRLEWGGPPAACIRARAEASARRPRKCPRLAGAAVAKPMAVPVGRITAGSAGASSISGQWGASGHRHGPGAAARRRHGPMVQMRGRAEHLRRCIQKSVIQEVSQVSSEQSDQGRGALVQVRFGRVPHGTGRRAESWTVHPFMDLSGASVFGGRPRPDRCNCLLSNACRKW